MSVDLKKTLLLTMYILGKAVNDTSIDLFDITFRFIATDMSSYKGPKSVEDGAKPIIFAATLPPKTTIKGAYIWEDSTVTSWVEENVSLVY